MNKKAQIATAITILLALILVGISIYIILEFDDNMESQSAELAEMMSEIEFNNQYILTQAKLFGQNLVETCASCSPEQLKTKSKFEESQFKLYDLIWRRFIACQMSQATFDSTTIDISAKNYTFRANGQILKFEGFLKI